MDIPPTAADYAQASADAANRKATSNEEKLDHLITIGVAIMLGLFGREKSRDLLQEAKRMGF